MDYVNPIEMLKNDHRTVEGLFNDFDSTDPGDFERKRSIAEDACEALSVHAKVEEDVFYPEVENISDEGREMIGESRKEHQEMRDLISALGKSEPQEAVYQELFEQLEGSTLHHVQEEESRVFPFAEANLKDKLGAGMAAKMAGATGKEMIKEKME